MKVKTVYWMQTKYAILDTLIHFLGIYMADNNARIKVIQPRSDIPDTDIPKEPESPGVAARKVMNAVQDWAHAVGESTKRAVSGFIQKHNIPRIGRFEAGAIVGIAVTVALTSWVSRVLSSEFRRGAENATLKQNVTAQQQAIQNFEQENQALQAKETKSESDLAVAQKQLGIDKKENEKLSDDNYDLQQKNNELDTTNQKTTDDFFKYILNQTTLSGIDQGTTYAVTYASQDENQYPFSDTVRTKIGILIMEGLSAYSQYNDTLSFIQKHHIQPVFLLPDDNVVLNSGSKDRPFAIYDGMAKKLYIDLRAFGPFVDDKGKPEDILDYFQTQNFFKHGRVSCDDSVSNAVAGAIAFVIDEVKNINPRGILVFGKSENSFSSGMNYLISFNIDGELNCDFPLLSYIPDAPIQATQPKRAASGEMVEPKPAGRQTIYLFPDLKFER